MVCPIRAHVDPFKQLIHMVPISSVDLNHTIRILFYFVVFHRECRQCQAAVYDRRFARLTAERGFIANSVTYQEDSRGCGSSSCPWKIEVEVRTRGTGSSPGLCGSMTHSRRCTWVTF